MKEKLHHWKRIFFSFSWEEQSSLIVWRIHSLHSLHLIVRCILLGLVIWPKKATGGSIHSSKHTIGPWNSRLLINYCLWLWFFLFATLWPDKLIRKNLVNFQINDCNHTKRTLIRFCIDLPSVSRHRLWLMILILRGPKFGQNVVFVKMYQQLGIIHRFWSLYWSNFQAVKLFSIKETAFFLC